MGRRCKAKDVVAVLEELTSICSGPAFSRSDNAPEIISQALRNWCEGSGTATEFIEPGSSWENSFSESYELRSTSSTTAALGMNSSTPIVHHSSGSSNPGRSLALGVQLAQATLGPPGACAPGDS